MSFKDIRLITPENLEQLLKKNKFSTYRSKQIQNWARKINVQSFDQMSNLPSDLIQFLSYLIINTDNDSKCVIFYNLGILSICK